MEKKIETTFKVFNPGPLVWALNLPYYVYPQEFLDFVTLKKREMNKSMFKKRSLLAGPPKRDP